MPLTDHVRLALGNRHSMVLKQDGSVWSTGVDVDGQRESFVKVISGDAVAAAAGNYYSIVVKQDGGVWTTGKNSKGHLSFFDGSATTRSYFYFARSIRSAKVVAAGGFHCLILSAGRVWVAGWNKFGQLGTGSNSDKTKFFEIIPDVHTERSVTVTVAVAAGDTHSILLRENGSVWAAGGNNNGQLGDGSKTERNVFVKVIPSGASGLAAGGYHSVVVKKDGSVWATGANEYGQLGDGSTQTSCDYIEVVSSGAKSVATGSRHSMMLKQDGSVWATGYNVHGQIGDGSTRNCNIFEKVIENGVWSIAAGAFHSMAIKRDGSIWATGSNQHGQFGDGTTISQENFVRLAQFDIGAEHDTNLMRAFCLYRYSLGDSVWFI